MNGKKAKKLRKVAKQLAQDSNYLIKHKDKDYLILNPLCEKGLMKELKKSFK